MSTRKLIKGDRYRAGLWKLEDSCYEGACPYAQRQVHDQNVPLYARRGGREVRFVWRRKASTSLRMGPGKPARAASTTVWGPRGAR